MQINFLNDLVPDLDQLLSDSKYAWPSICDVTSTPSETTTWNLELRMNKSKTNVIVHSVHSTKEVQTSSKYYLIDNKDIGEFRSCLKSFRLKKPTIQSHKFEKYSTVIDNELYELLLNSGNRTPNLPPRPMSIGNSNQIKRDMKAQTRKFTLKWEAW
jgi:hypothetical protein